jgi:hypothetical protein
MKAMKILLSFALVLACAPAASANTVFWDDDFESYADQAGFDAAWPNFSGTQPTWSTDQSTSPTHSILEPAGSPGRVVSATTYPDSINGSDAAPLVLEYDIYINPNDLTSSRRYVEMRQTSGDLNIFAIGLSNLATNPTSNFAFRNQFAWIDLAAPRLPGWNHVEAVIDTQKINITINSEPTESFFRNSVDDYGTIYMGSNFTNNTADPFDGFTYIDNMSVERIPEPASLALLGLGGIAMALVARRRR